MCSRILLVICTVGALLGIQASASATFVGDLIKYDGVTVNTVNAANFAGVYRSGSWVNIGFNQMQVGDHLVAVLKGYIVNGVGDNLYTGEFTGYLVLRVSEVFSGLKWYQFTHPSVDPFSILDLTKKEALVLYVDASADFADGENFYSLGARSTDVQNATNGSLFGSFGFQNVPGMSAPLIGANFTASGIELLGGLNVVNSPWGFPGVQNPAASKRFNSLGLHISFPNPNAGDKKDWLWSSADAITFRVTPEPGTMTALLAMGGAAALGLALRRRKES